MDIDAARELKQALTSQYRAAFHMLRTAIDRCPEDEWARADERNPFWQVAYHALYYTHLYLQPSLSRFEAWERHDKQFAALGTAIEGDAPDRSLVLEYCTYCTTHVDEWMARLDLTAPKCGFWWYKMGKLEHQLVNLRHLQHHAAQLADRLRLRIDVGVEWAADG